MKFSEESLHPGCCFQIIQPLMKAEAVMTQATTTRATISTKVKLTFSIFLTIFQFLCFNFFILCFCLLPT